MTSNEQPISFDLDNHLFYLFGRALVARDRSLGEHLSMVGLTVNHWRILATLSARGSLNVIRLAELTLIDRTTLSRIIDKMCKNGLVIRHEDEKDRRGKILSLDTKGHFLLSTVLPFASTQNLMAVEGLSNDEIELFGKLLRKVITNLERCAMDIRLMS